MRLGVEYWTLPSNLSGMSNGKDFADVVELIQREDPRFEKGAYFFVRQALDHTLKNIKKQQQEQTRTSSHVSGHELLEGIRDFALEQYGPMSLTLLNTWNVQTCSDFGDIVFNLVDYGVLGKTENDRPEDFRDGYDFFEAFAKPFLPSQPVEHFNRVFSAENEEPNPEAN